MACALERQIQFAVVSVVVDFLKPAVLDDEILVTAELVRLAVPQFGSSRPSCAISVQLIDASIRVACLDSGTLKPRAIPKDLFTEWRNGQ